MRIATTLLAAGLLTFGCASGSPPPVDTPDASASPTLGKFVWHDLSTDDLPAARAFYAGLLGWELRDTTRRGRPYVVAYHEGRPVGGMVAVDPVRDRAVSQWVAFASVDDVDGTASSFEEAGGRTLIEPLDIAAGGRAAVVIDPQGAVLGLVDLLDDALAADGSSPRPGTFFWMEYLAQDADAAVDFYTGTFGYSAQPTGTASRPYTVLARGRARAGILQAPEQVERPIWLPSILVDDPSALAERARSLGGTVLLEPRDDIRSGSLAIVADPSGGVVALQKFPY